MQSLVRLAYPPQEIVPFLLRSDTDIISEDASLSTSRCTSDKILLIIGQVITSISNHILHVFHDIEILPDFLACAKYF